MTMNSDASYWFGAGFMLLWVTAFDVAGLPLESSALGLASVACIIVCLYIGDFHE